MISIQSDKTALDIARQYGSDGVALDLEEVAKLVNCYSLMRTVLCLHVYSCLA